MAANQEDIGSLLVSVSANLSQFNSEMKKMTKTAAEEAKKTEKAVTGANDNMGKSFSTMGDKAQRSMRAARAEAANMSAQFQDISVQLQGGTSPWTIAMQQGTQLASVLQNVQNQGGGLFKSLGGALLTFLNPIQIGTILAIGLGGSLIKSFLGAGTSAEKATKALDDYIAHLKEIKKLAEDTENTPLLLDTQIKIDTAQAKEAGLKAQKDMQDEINKVTGADQGKFSNLLNFGGTQPHLQALATAIADLATFEIATTGADEKTRKLRESFDEMMKDFAAGRVDDAVKLFESLSTIDIGTAFDPSMLAEFTKELHDAHGEVDKILAIQERWRDTIQKGEMSMESYQKALQDVNKSLDQARALWQPPISDLEKMLNLYQAAALAAERIAAATGDTTLKLRIQQELQQGINTMLDQTRLDIAKSTSDLSGFEKIVAQIESGGDLTKGFHDQSKSSAFGAFGFTKGTFISALRTIRQYNDLYLEEFKKAQNGGASPQDAARIANDAVWNLKSNFKIQEEAFKAHAEQIDAQLMAKGQELTDPNRYIMWWMGVGGGSKILLAPENTLLGKIIGLNLGSHSEALAGKTVAQFKEMVSKKVESARKIAAPTSFEGEVQDIQNRADAMHAEAASADILGVAIDELTFKKEKAKITEELLQKAREDGSEATAEERKRIDEVSTALATEEARTKGVTEAKKNDKVWTDFKNKSEKEGEAITDDVIKQRQQLAQQMAQMGTQFITSFVSGLEAGKSATEALRDSLKSLVDQLLQMVLNKTLMTLFSSMFNVPLAPGAGFSLGGSSGGRVGGGNFRPRSGMSPFGYLGAPRMASGGFVGVQPGEFPTILHRGEVVIPASMVKQAMGMSAGGSSSGGGETKISVGDVSITTQMNGSGDVKADTARGKALGHTVLAIVQTEIARQSRPGGMLTASGSAGRVGR